MKQRITFIVDTTGDYEKGAPTKLADMTQGQKDNIAAQEAAVFGFTLNQAYGESEKSDIKMLFTVESAKHLED